MRRIARLGIQAVAFLIQRAKRTMIRISHVARWSFLFILSVALGGIGHSATQQVDLAHRVTACAMHPDTGDLLVADARRGEVLLYLAADLADGKKTPKAKTTVGTMPSAICFKKFADKEYFAVVCMRDAHLYLIDAKSGALVRKIPVTEAGVSYATASSNNADPFVYYNVGTEHQSRTGAVNLRDMKDKGIVFGDSMDCAISASGRTAYRRGPWSPTGFESLMLTNSLGDDKPVFERQFYHHDSTDQYVPDPFDSFTAAGPAINTTSLEKNEAEQSKKKDIK
jgi:hypothetical protein